MISAVHGQLDTNEEKERKAKECQALPICTFSVERKMHAGGKPNSM